MTAIRRPKRLGRPSTHWSLRKLADHLADNPVGTCASVANGCAGCCTNSTSRFSAPAPARNRPTRPSRPSSPASRRSPRRFADRCFAFDQFGPLSIRPTQGTGWARQQHPDRRPATYRRTHGIRYLHGCYSYGDDRLWGVLRRRKGADHSLAAFRSMRAARPDGAPIYLICDNLSANTTPAIRAWAARNKVERCLTPTSASWANPIEARFGPLRSFALANSHHPNHTVLARDLHAYLRWRNANARHPDVLAAQRRERARIRGERHRRWRHPTTRAA